MKKYLMLPMALVMAVSIAACSNTRTENPQADFAAPPPPAAGATDPMAPPVDDPLAPPPAM